MQPLAAAALGHAIHAAGFAEPEGAARWLTWLAEHAPDVRATGTGADCRLSLA